MFSAIVTSFILHYPTKDELHGVHYLQELKCLGKIEIFRARCDFNHVDLAVHSVPLLGDLRVFRPSNIHVTTHHADLPEVDTVFHKDGAIPSFIHALHDILFHCRV